MRNRISSFNLILLLLYLPGTALAVIDPSSFPTTGSLNVSSGFLDIDTNLNVIKLNGTVIAGGIPVVQPNGIDLIVYAFNDIQITGSTNILVLGSRPFALASKGSATVSVPLLINGNGTSSSTGGYGGGAVQFDDDYPYRDGIGPGGGETLGDPIVATGGGFGGAGGAIATSGQDGPGGRPYGNLLSSIEGGSGGASGQSGNQIVVGPGGGGGGGMAIVAVGAVSIGTISANGNGSDFGGGGAGGGILLSGSTVAYNSLSARGGAIQTANSRNTGGGGGRIAILGTSTFAMDSTLPNLNVNGGGSLTASGTTKTDGRAGVVTVSPLTFVATGTHVLDGSLLVRPVNFSPTYEVEVRRNMQISSGARVTLGKNQPLDLLVGPTGASLAQLQIDQGGIFDTGNYTQRVGALIGLGDLRLSDGGRITIDGATGFGGSISGTGTLAVSPGASLTLATNGLAAWTGAAEITGTLEVTVGPFNARVRNVGNTAELRLGYNPAAPSVDLGGDLTDFHGTLLIQNGTVSVVTLGALDTPANVVFSEFGIPTLDLMSNSASIGSLSGTNPSASINLGGNLVGSALTIGSRNANSTFAGSISDSGGLIKVGSGVQAFSGTLNYTGPTTVREGTLVIQSPMPSGGTVRVEAAGELLAAASIERSIAGVGASSIINISASQSISLGNASSYLGFSNQGELRVGTSSVTLNAAGLVRPGGLTRLGFQQFSYAPGTLTAPNGALVDFGEAITGYGTIDTPNTLAKRTIINGVAQGASTANPLTFTGYVKGTGSFDNVNFTGTFSPGLSPAITYAGNIALAPSSTLFLEIGGLDAGSGYDKIEATGTLDIHGALNGTLLGGFMPTLGHSFDLLDWGSLAGSFSSLSLPSLNAGLSWNTSQLYTTGVLSVIAVLPGDFDHDGDVDGRDFLVWQRNPAVGNLADWQANYGNPLTVNSNAVPEPGSFLLIVLATSSCCLSLRSSLVRFTI